MRLFRSLLVFGAAALLVGLGIPNAAATSDPYWNRQYGPVQIGAPAAWTKSTGTGIKVSVVDSGVDVEHPDLIPNLDRADSYDYGCGDDNPDDDSTEKDSEDKLVKGHGTHVSGTIAAVANNGIGVAGVAPNVKLMVMKVFPSNPTCGSFLSALTNVSQAINRSVDRGAKVINLSLSEFQLGNGLFASIETPCNNAFRSGSLCVVAAGNSGETQSSGFAKDFNGLVVTANDSTGAHASFGQKADTKWGVSAPGVAVLNTWPIDDPDHDGYNAIQGTSMAAPHVAGAAAVLFGMGMSAQAVAQKLVDTAGPARDSLVEGAGIIHLDRAAGVQTTATTNAAQRTSGAGTVTKGGRAGVAGGTGAIPATTTTSTPGSREPSSGFEEGLSTKDASKNFDQIRLNQARRNGASKPFNAAGPLVAGSAIATLAMLAVAIPRMRAKDTPLT